jgi:CheY-like chemotaxis protein
LLAGRKLLLADDSITIQKVVDLTFADEGVSVVCVDNGREAIERLEEFVPDVILADVLMPLVNGYELCEYVKQHDHLKHIPVMLLVGSFEPYDAEEARRVGANDTLTKPFQSIRRLIDKVGQLVSSRPPEEQIPTAELPKPDVPEPEVERLSASELEITTADTKPLPEELRHVVEAAAAARAQQEEAQALATASSGPTVSEAAVPLGDEAKGALEQSMAENSNQVSETYEGAGEVLLDLGEYGVAPAGVDDEFILDLDLDEEPEPAEAVYQVPAYAAGASSLKREHATSDSEWSTNPLSERHAPVSEAPREFERVLDEPVGVAEVASATQPVETAQLESEVTAAPVAVSEVASDDYSAATALVAPANVLSLGQLSPEMIDAIARRAVEQLSEKVVQEIAWEVVPQLAELLIKRQLEEKNS